MLLQPSVSQAPLFQASVLSRLYVSALIFQNKASRRFSARRVSSESGAKLMLSATRDRLLGPLWTGVEHEVGCGRTTRVHHNVLPLSTQPFLPNTQRVRTGRNIMDNIVTMQIRK